MSSDDSNNVKVECIVLVEAVKMGGETLHTLRASGTGTAKLGPTPKPVIEFNPDLQCFEVTLEGNKDGPFCIPASNVRQWFPALR